MATYKEIFTMISDDTSDLKERVTIALAKKCNDVCTNSSSDKHQRALAFMALMQPKTHADRFFVGVLTSNVSDSIATIQAYSDTDVQTKVDAIFDSIAMANAGV